MPKKTIQEIQETVGEEASALLGDWYATQDAIRNSYVSVDAPNGVTLTGQQHMQAAGAQKAALAAQKARAYREEYVELAKNTGERIKARTARLHKENFSVADTRDLKDAFGYSDEKLAEAVRIAKKTGNAEFAKAAFAVADERGLEGVVAAYLEAYLEAREPYEELKGAPDDEMLERRLQVADNLFAAPSAFDLAYPAWERTVRRTNSDASPCRRPPRL